jgi:hypothetical protein
VAKPVRAIDLKPSVPAKYLLAMAGFISFAGTQAAPQTAQKQILPTQIQDRSAFERLLGNSGMSVQWISWSKAERGPVEVSYRQKILSLRGEQKARGGNGRVALSGTVARISKSEFILNGTIIIEDTPDMGRRCEQTGEWRFAVTQNRKYWRLRQFEWCDYLTDYIDIYF